VPTYKLVVTIRIQALRDVFIQKQNNTTFRDFRFPSSGDRVRKDVLSWGRQNEVLPVSAGVVPTLEPSNLWDGIESVPPCYASHGPDNRNF